ncbi:MAG: hypothetical protein OHK0013_32950 [Sandaracinaceae bacterium]
MSEDQHLTALSTTQALLCVLGALASASDDVIVVGDDVPEVAAAAELGRFRARRSDLDGVFDAIGEHTRALVVRAPGALELEALLELGLPVVLLEAPHGVEPAAHTSLVRLDPHGRVVNIRCEAQAVSFAPRIARRLAALVPETILQLARAE